MMTMKFNLKQLLFVITLFCVALTLLRRPILSLLQFTPNYDITICFESFYVHWLWLLGFDIQYTDINSLPMNNLIFS